MLDQILSNKQLIDAGWVLSLRDGYGREIKLFKRGTHGEYVFVHPTGSYYNTSFSSLEWEDVSKEITKYAEWGGALALR